MAELIVPPLENDSVWPSLGSQVADWQEANLAFGPGDLLGKPYRLDDEDRALLERGYQVYPPDHSGPCRFTPESGGWRCGVGGGRCGRRRFTTVVLMLRKGSKKSERLAATAAAEMAADGPVRCDGFRRQGRAWLPVGRPVVSPFVFLFAFAKEQAEDTAWDALSKMIELGPGASQFQVWEERILRSDGTGEAKPLASAPDSRDGSRTTFQGKEESHRWYMPRHKEAHRTTVGNLSKRPIAEPWEMHATTAYAPGEGSVAEDLHDAARKLIGDDAKRSRTFFFYRWADESIKIRDKDGALDPVALRRAIRVASGTAIARWSDEDDIAQRQFVDAGSDSDYAERVWLNRTRRMSRQAFDTESWKRDARSAKIKAGARIVLGFDGSRGTDDPRGQPDHSGLVAVDVLTGLIQPLGHWDPLTFGGKIPRQQVDLAVDDAFSTYDVWRLYGDPPGWDVELASWAAQYGEERVISWHTWRDRAMGFACRNFAEAIRSGELIHTGDATLSAHVGQAHRRYVNARDDKNERLWTVQKERDGSPLKIDLAVCAVLAWQARTDAVRAGAATPPVESVYEHRGFRVLRIELRCPDCSRDGTVLERHDGHGWRCDGRLGGCGQVFGLGDPRIVEQLAEDEESVT